MINAPLFDRFLSLTLPPLPAGARFYQPLLVGLIIALGLAIAWLPPLLTALVLSGTILLLLLLHAPILCLYVLIPLIPFSSLIALSISGVRVGLMEIVLGLGVMAGLLRLSVRPQPSRPGRGGSVQFLGPFGLLLGVIGLSWLNTLSMGASLVETAKWVEMLALYLLVITFLPTDRLGWVVAAMLLAASAQAILGLYQFIFKIGPPGFLLFDGRFLRAYGTFAQPNPFAGYLGLIIPLALALLAWQLLEFVKAPGEQKLPAFKWRILGIIGLSLLLSLLLAALFASQSRGAWLAFAVAAAATLIASSRKPGLYLALLLASGTIIALAGAFDSNINRAAAGGGNPAAEAITQRIVDAATIATITDIGTIEVTDANFATLERLAHWQAAREMWRDHPWLGVGFGNYALVYPAYAVGRWLDPLGHAHNYLLNIGAEAGLVGIIGYLIFWIYVFRVTWLTIQRSDGFGRAVAIGGFGTLVHLHIHNLFDNLYVQGMYLHVAVVLALVALIRQAIKRQDHK